MTFGYGATCFFHTTPDGYLCELLLANYLDQNAPFEIAGNHLPNYGDGNVTRLVNSQDFPSTLRFIPAAIFQRFPNLQFIQLTGTGIESVFGLQNCGQLQVLNVNNNNITSFTSSPFLFCSNLREIHAEYNSISQINVDSFNGLPLLNTLRLRNNLITSLIPGTLNLLPELQVIDLERNRLDQIPSDLFINLQRLEQIILEYNVINRINTRGFNNLPGLRVLDINSNLISEIEANAFTAIGALERLYLNNNLIPHLNSSYFSSNLPNLQILSVQNNVVTAIERNFFQNFPNLVHFNMLNNYCADGEFFPFTDPNFLGSMDQCFQNYDGVTTPGAPTTVTTTSPIDLTSPIVTPPVTVPTDTTTAEATTTDSGLAIAANIQLSMMFLALIFFLSRTN